MTTTTTSKQEASQARALVPVRYAAWLSGDLGKQMQDELSKHLGAFVKVTKMPRGFLLEADERTSGALADQARQAIEAVEDEVAKRYPVFWHEMGPVWTGTVQTIYKREA